MLPVGAVRAPSGCCAMCTPVGCERLACPQWVLCVLPVGAVRAPSGCCAMCTPVGCERLACPQWVLCVPPVGAVRAPSGCCACPQWVPCVPPVGAVLGVPQWVVNALRAPSGCCACPRWVLCVPPVGAVRAPSGCCACPCVVLTCTAVGALGPAEEDAIAGDVAASLVAARRHPLDGQAGHLLVRREVDGRRNVSDWRTRQTSATGGHDRCQRLADMTDVRDFETR